MIGFSVYFFVQYNDEKSKWHRASFEVLSEIVPKIVRTVLLSYPYVVLLLVDSFLIILQYPKGTLLKVDPSCLRIVLVGVTNMF